MFSLSALKLYPRYGVSSQNEHFRFWCDLYPDPFGRKSGIRARNIGFTLSARHCRGHWERALELFACADTKYGVRPNEVEWEHILLASLSYKTVASTKDQRRQVTRDIIVNWGSPSSELRRAYEIFITTVLLRHTCECIALFHETQNVSEKNPYRFTWYAAACRSAQR